ncbi:hypothetical protein ACP4OV_020958 [Aristida adscensionis]
MATGGERSCEGCRRRSENPLHGGENDADAEWKLARWPGTRFVNRCAVIHAYLRTAVRLLGSLLLLWSTVVLLGGFVSSLQTKDFWFITIISIIQAIGCPDDRRVGVDDDVFRGDPFGEDSQDLEDNTGLADDFFEKVEEAEYNFDAEDEV